MSEQGGASRALWADADEGEMARRYRALVTAVGEGVCHVDPAGRFADVDDDFAALLGADRDALVGEHVSTALADESADRLASTVRTLSDPGAVADLDLVVAGDDRTVTLRLTPLAVDDELRGTVGVVVDSSPGSTDGDDAVEPLATVLDAIDVGVLVFDDGDELVRANDAVGRSFGCDPAALCGRDRAAVVEALAAQVANDDRFTEHVAGDGGDQETDATPAEESDFEFRVRDGDGAGRWLRYRTAPVEAGRLAGGRIDCYYDVTDHRRTERTLQERERDLATYETIVETVEDGIYVVDGDGRFTMVNEAYAEMLGYEREALLGEHVSLVVDDETVERARKLEAQLRDGEADQSVIEADLETASGDTVPAEATFALLPTPGEDDRRVGVARDVSERVERERQLERNERRYRTLAEYFPNGIVTLFDHDLEYELAAGQGFEKLSVDPADLEGRHFREVWDEDTADALEPVFQAALAGEERGVELAYRGRDWTVEAVPITDERGDVFAGMTMAQDITERKVYERQLAESERRYRTLAENFPNGAVGIFDPDLRYTLVAGRKIGDDLPDADRMEGGRFPDIFPDHVVEDLGPLYRGAVEDGETGSTTTEFNDRIWRVWATPLRDADGEIYAGLSFAQDVTEQVERERELERALDLLNKTERIADVAGWEIDPDTQQPYWSDHLFDLVGVEHDEQPTLDEALDVYHTEEDRALVEEAVAEALETGESFDIEARFSRPGGDVGWLRVQGDPEVRGGEGRDPSDNRMASGDGEVVSLRGAVQDVTEQRERERRLEDLVDRLEASNERLEQFAYAASHDLQEPLRMVSSYLSLIERRYGDDLDDDGREFLGFAVDGADRMREMIDALLEYSRVETRGNPLEPVDLHDVVGDVLADFQVRVEETDADVAVGSLPTVRGDGDQLRQVFGNLLSNAIEYSGDDPPQVAITAESDGQWVTVAVEDDGIGIDPEHTDRIFQVFQRLHTQDEHSGTGIGLALCRRIVERHGGDIRVESEPGEGTTFYVTLRAARNRSQDAGPADSGASGASDGEAGGGFAGGDGGGARGDETGDARTGGNSGPDGTDRNTDTDETGGNAGGGERNG